MLTASLRRQQGASLIEVLVSIVIASIGLLALAGVNAASIRYAKLSQYRATAALLANDIGERMRANKAGVSASNYTFLDDFETQATAPTAPVTTCGAGDTCSAADIAALDLYQWRQTVRSMLPEGSANLTYNGGQVAADVFVVWRDPSTADDDERPAGAKECPDALSRGSDLSIRCMFFRINI